MREFLTIAGDRIDRYGAGCLSWALMPNHYHLVLVERHEGSIDAVMRSLLRTWARRFNDGTGRDGRLFERPYRARRIVGREDMLNTLTYVNLNPRERDRTRCSSHGVLLGESPGAPWLDASAATAIVGGDSTYRDFASSSAAVRAARRRMRGLWG